jgi:uncharacterized protein (TIGR02996 family)
MPEMSSELRGLLAACRDCPADDTPRLVLADWLDEHADAIPDATARADLLRIQVELSRPSSDTLRQSELQTHEQQILSEHLEQWGEGLPAVFAELGNIPQVRDHTTLRAMMRLLPAYRPIELRRGFLELRLQAVDLRSKALQAWFASERAEWVQAVTIHISDVNELNRLEVPPVLAPFVAVHLSVGVARFPTRGPRVRLLSKTACRQLLHSPKLPFVRSLTLAHNAVRGGLLSLMPDANLSGLRFLTINCAILTDNHAVELARTPLDNLSSLNLAANTIGPVGIAALAESPHLGRLITLSLYRNQLGDQGVKILANSRLASSLRTVFLQNNGVGTRGVKELCASPLLGRLVGPELNLSMNQIPDAGAKALAECEHLANFRELVLRENAIGPAGAAALADSPFAANLTYLDLFQNKIGNRGAAALAESEHLSRIRDLNLRDNGITNVDALRERYGNRVKT